MGAGVVGWVAGSVGVGASDGVGVGVSGAEVSDAEVSGAGESDAAADGVAESVGGELADDESGVGESVGESGPDESADDAESDGDSSVGAEGGSRTGSKVGVGSGVGNPTIAERVVLGGVSGVDPSVADPTGGVGDVDPGQSRLRRPRSESARRPASGWHDRRSGESPDRPSAQP